jgi:hypothetical protein
VTQIPAKNKACSRRADTHSDLAAHMDAMRRATQWAEKCLALREAGKTRQTDAADKKALHCDCAAALNAASFTLA